MTSRVLSVRDPDAVAALTHPTRVRILDALRSPDSAAGAARALGESRQRVNYHLKELARAGLVRPAGERRKGNFVEQLYEAVASTFVVSPRLAWGDERRQHALADQVSLEHLVELGERLQRDASGLLDRAAFDAETIPSASVEAEVSFADAESRRAFMEDYLAALGPLLDKHGAKRGAPFRVAVAVYPDPTDENDREKRST
jgi:DNA-binding transcriptional ArsR family regulator